MSCSNPFPLPANACAAFAPGHARALEALIETRARALETPVFNASTTPTRTEFPRVDTAGLDWDGALRELRKAGAL